MAAGVEVLRELDPLLQLAQRQLAELGVGADQVEVDEARVDRDAAQADALEQRPQRAPPVGVARRWVQVRRRRRQLDLGDAVAGEVGDRRVERRVMQVAEGRPGERGVHDPSYWLGGERLRTTIRGSVMSWTA